MRTPILAGATLVVVVAFTASASAEPSAEEHSAELAAAGSVAYNLGDFDRAVELFKEAYKARSDSYLLFNIAQSHRQLGDCRDALFFYRRFLSETADEANRKTVEERIDDLEANCREEERLKSEPPVHTIQAARPTPPVVVSDVADVADDEPAEEDSDDAAADASVEAVAAQPSSSLSAWLVRGAVGGSVISDTRTVLTTVPIAQVGLERLVGPLSALISIEVSPVPWEDGSRSGASTLVSAGAGIGMSRRIVGQLSMRGSVTAGVASIFAAEGNELLLEDGTNASNPLVLANGRAEAGLDYEFRRGFGVRVTPLAVAASPVSNGFRSGMQVLVRFQPTIGIRYAP